MAHRSQQVGPVVEFAIKAAVNTVVFFVAWIFMPWWLALILAVCGFTAWFLAEQVDWREIDWHDLLFGWLE